MQDFGHTKGAARAPKGRTRKGPRLFTLKHERQWNVRGNCLRQLVRDMTLKLEIYAGRQLRSDNDNELPDGLPKDDKKKEQNMQTTT